MTRDSLVEAVEASRRRQNLPPRIQDPAASIAVASLVRRSRRAISADYRKLRDTGLKEIAPQQPQAGDLDSYLERGADSS